MAFPIPSHLPLEPNPQDVSLKILSKIDESTKQTLTASLASSWLTELEETIQAIKKRVRDRIHTDLPSFDRQLEASKSLQIRLQALTTNVDKLSHTLSDSETGLIPVLVRALTAHAELAQNSSDADVTQAALSHLLRCRSEFRSLSDLVQQGKLPDAVRVCEGLENLLETPPIPLDQAEVMADLKRNFRVLKDRTEEQLSDAFLMSIVVSTAEIILRPSVQIRRSSVVLPISSILSSLSSSSLTTHLTTLRRDLTSHYVTPILLQPTSINVTSSHGEEHILTLCLSPPTSEHIPTCLSNLSTIVLFLSTHLFPSLPPSHASSFPQSLCGPITSSIITHVLIPSLPSSFSLLPQFLDLLRNAVAFEEHYVVQILGNSPNDKPVKAWADGVCGHYERKRRVDILEEIRRVIVGGEHEGTFTVEVEVLGHEEERMSDRGQKVENKLQPDMDRDGWGFDEGKDEKDTPAPETSSEEDPTDAWGWNDDDEPEAELKPTLPSPPPETDEEETVWDDPWGEEEDAPSISSPKAATRLEKLSPKGQGKNTQTNGHSPTPVPVTMINLSSKAQLPPLLPPPHVTLKGTYLVSLRTKHIINIVEDVLREVRQLTDTAIFPSSPSSSTPGIILQQTASSALDLWRALYPVASDADLANPGRSMRFSNDCLFLSEEIRRIQVNQRDDEGLEDCREALRVLGDSWFDDEIDKQRRLVDGILASADGFTDSAEQYRYDEYEGSIMSVVNEVRGLGRQWRNVLIKSKYYFALGLVVDAALSRILTDILALPDIPEVESRRLSELCRILNALEGLFVEDPEHPSFVVAYVPSWLKFSYLSELLEASMADITYLFEQGALVDFEVEELAKLIRALFADTPLRASTIGKLMGGHPING